MTDSIQGEVDPREPSERLLRDLRSRREGLSQREAGRRLVAYGPNELQRTTRASWWRDVRPSAHAPVGAAARRWQRLLAWASGSAVVAGAIVAVIIANALFAFVQEQQAERAVEALAAYLPQRATVVRDGSRRSIEARDLVPGDILEIAEGDKISADARLLSGALEVDTSALTGESAPRLPLGRPHRYRRPVPPGARPRVQRNDLHRRGGADSGVRDRDAHRARQNRRALRTWATGGKSARTSGAACRSNHRAGGRRNRSRLPAARHGRRSALLRRRGVCSRSHRRERARGSPADHHARPGPRRSGARTARRAREAAQRSGDPRIDQRDLHRQDRHAHGEPHARRCRSRRSTATSTSPRTAHATAITTTPRSVPLPRRVARCSNAELDAANGSGPSGDPTELALLTRRGRRSAPT